MYVHRVPLREDTYRGLLPFTRQEVPQMKRNGRLIVAEAKHLSEKHYGGESAPVGGMKTCEHCGQEYVPRNKTQRVCYSSPCRDWLKRNYNSSLPDLRVCVICSRGFSAAKRTPKATCGSDCAKELSNRTREAKKRMLAPAPDWADPFLTMETYNNEVHTWLDARMCPMG